MILPQKKDSKGRKYLFLEHSSKYINPTAWPDPEIQAEIPTASSNLIES